MKRHNFMGDKPISLPLTLAPKPAQIWLHKKRHFQIALEHHVSGKGNNAIWEARIGRWGDKITTQVMVGTLLMEYERIK